MFKRAGHDNHSTLGSFQQRQELFGNSKRPKNIHVKHLHDALHREPLHKAIVSNTSVGDDGPENSGTQLLLNLLEGLIDLLFFGDIELQHLDIGQFLQLRCAWALGVEAAGKDQETVAVQSVHKCMAEAGVAPNDKDRFSFA